VLYQTAKTRAVTVTLMFTVLLVGILKGVERPRSVYSTMPQWCHLTVLQAASFHLPSVSIANSNTVQYTKPYQQCEIATIPDLVISKMLLPQFSIIMAASVHSHSSLFFDVSSCLPKYNKHNIKNLYFYSVRPLAAEPLRLLPKCPTANIQQHTLISQCLTAMCQ